MEIERRNLVLCLDGTSNEIGARMTNVARIFRALEKSERQLVFYGSGVGSMDDGVAISTIGKLVRKGIDLGIAYRLGAQVLEAYLFLCANYQKDDRVAFIGYSRGAFAARAAAGMVKMFGLLKPEHFNMAPYLWKVFSTAEGDNLFITGNTYRAYFSRPPVEIEFVGLFDTVSSFGLFTKLRTIPYSHNNSLIKVMRQAASIDEKRAYFPLQGLPVEGGDYLQVWFAGVHSDIGGGGKASQLPRAKVAMEWMMGEARTAGLRFCEKRYAAVLRSPAPTVDPEFPRAKSWSVVWLLFGLVPMRRWNNKRSRFTWRWFNFWNVRVVECGAHVHVSAINARSGGRYAPKNWPCSPVPEGTKTFARKKCGCPDCQ